ncbi:MAG: hypothetical protein KIT11_03295 [Fimbriimonadaceae bacterium]|nr:hypothetical protein [Fimbriimonadaceae bacterium]QYK57077.1 MAG: hypothetical protein KF733_06230 [Fimbriimonadaceae bacterium]
MFRWREPKPGVWVGADGGNWYAVQADGPRLSVESNAAESDFRALFSLGEDQDRVRREAVSHLPVLAEALAATGGLRLMRPSDAVETLFCFLCTANNHLARITSMVESLARRGPFLAAPHGVALHAFPSLAQLASLTESALRAEAFGYRARTIPLVAQRVVELGGAAWLRGLAEAPYAEAHAALVRLPGIGPKLADCVALFALGHGEAVPVDVHVRNAYCRLCQPTWRDKALTARRYDEIGDWLRSRFGSHSGLVHQVLFVDELHRRRTAPR